MALSDEQIEILTDKYLMDLYQDLEQEVIQDIARRVRKTERLTETAEIMAKSMAEQGYDPSEIYSEVMKSLNANKAYQELIAENTREYKREVMEKIRDTEKEAEAAGNKLIAEAGTMSFNDDLQMWQQAKQDLPGADGMKQIVEGFQKHTAGELRNLTRTTGFKGSQLGTVKVQNAYQRSLDLATLKMCSGAFSYDQACNDSIKQLAQSGLRSINYASGRTYQLDTAVRMCVRTAGSQLAGKITEENCNKTGQDLVITSQHIGARPSHLNFENKVFSLSGKSKKYPAFSDPIEAGGAGYGEVAGIKGVNCRHDFFPFWEGISKIPKKIEQPAPKWYQGKEYNYYDATQKQRAMEREIRELKRERYSTDDPEERRAINRQIKEKSKEYRDFSKAMDIRPKENRLLMPGERNPYAGTAKGISAEIDELTPCLRRLSDGKIVQTTITRIHPKKKDFSDWMFNWSLPEKKGYQVFQLTAEGDDRVQGLIALKPEKENYAVHVDIVESSPFNTPANPHFEKKEYAGVGGHLFAEAVRQSYEYGYDGYVYFQAKSGLVKYYQKELNAQVINPRDRIMVIDERAAKALYEKYYGKNRGVV